MLLLVPLLVASSLAKSPYLYQADPMARVAMEHRAYTGRSTNPYMVGEQFFKKDSIDFPGSPTKPWEEGSDGYEGEQLPYTTMQVSTLPTMSTLCRTLAATSDGSTPRP